MLEFIKYGTLQYRKTKVNIQKKKTQQSDVICGYKPTCIFFNRIISYYAIQINNLYKRLYISPELHEAVVFL